MENIETIAEEFWVNDNAMSDNDRIAYIRGFLACDKYQQEKSYSEEEVIEILLNFRGENPGYIKEWFEQFKK